MPPKFWTFWGCQNSRGGNAPLPPPDKNIPVYVCIRTYVCMYVCMYDNVCVYVCMYVCVSPTLGMKMMSCMAAVPSMRKADVRTY